MRENLRYVIQYHAHTIRILVRIVAQTAKSASFACRFSLNIRQFSLTPAKMEMPMSTTWFVGADWLAEHIDDPEIQIIDARMASPGQEDRNVAQEYLNGHIPGAVFLISKRFLITLPRFRTCCRAWKRSPWRCVN